MLTVEVVPCPCGKNGNGCSTFQLNIGFWYQGAGFTLPQATLIAKALNEYLSKHPRAAKVLFDR